MNGNEKDFADNTLEIGHIPPEQVNLPTALKVREAVPPLPGRTITALAKMDDKTMVDESALAAALKLSKRSVRRMVQRNELPPPFRFAGKSTWFTGKVLAHIEARAEREARDAERAARKLDGLA